VSISGLVAVRSSEPPPSPMPIPGVNPRCGTSRYPIASVLESWRSFEGERPFHPRSGGCRPVSETQTGMDWIRVSKTRLSLSAQALTSFMLQSFSGLITTNGRSLQRLRCSGNSTPLSSWNKAHTRIACVMQPTTVEAHAFASASASRGGWGAGQRLLVICGGRVTLRTQCPCRAKTYKGLSPA
jgi:hypothetical protein